MAAGWDAWSCDFQPSETIGQHIVGDVFKALRERGPWDLAILHPPCTYLTVSANRWFSDTAKAGPGVLTGAARREAREDALAFVSALWRVCDELGIPHATENPIGVISSRLRKPAQTIQPWMFGHPDLKGTCLWLTGLPALVPTKIVPVEQRVASIHRMPPGKHRQRERSRTFRGIAVAMADQWSRALNAKRTA